MHASLSTRVVALCAMLAAVGPVLFASQLGINPNIDIGYVFPIWAGYSALASLGLFLLTGLCLAADVVALYRR